VVNILIVFLIFVAALLIVFGIGSLLWYLKERSDLVKKIEYRGGPIISEEQVTTSGWFKDTYLRVADFLGNMAKPKGKKGEEDISRMRKKFFHAGIARVKNIVMLFYGTKLLLVILFPTMLVLFGFAFFKKITPINLIFFLVLLACIGFYIPDIWLRIKIGNRQDMILRGFPDAMDLMVICAEAGMGLDSAMARVGEEMKMTNPPLSEELRLMTLELRAGKLRSDALRNLGLRTGLEDVESFATLLIQTDRFGTSIAQALRVQADTMRTRRYQRVEELAAKLPVKLIFPTILFIFPALFLVLMGPALIQAYRMWISR